MMTPLKPDPASVLLPVVLADMMLARVFNPTAEWSGPCFDVRTIPGDCAYMAVPGSLAKRMFEAYYGAFNPNVTPAEALDGEGEVHETPSSNATTDASDATVIAELSTRFEPASEFAKRRFKPPPADPSEP